MALRSIMTRIYLMSKCFFLILMYWSCTLVLLCLKSSHFFDCLMICLRLSKSSKFLWIFIKCKLWGLFFDKTDCLKFYTVSLILAKFAAYFLFLLTWFTVRNLFSVVPSILSCFELNASLSLMSAYAIVSFRGLSRIWPWQVAEATVGTFSVLTYLLSSSAREIW